jgi:hypothetical protein
MMGRCHHSSSHSIPSEKRWDGSQWISSEARDKVIQNFSSMKDYGMVGGGSLAKRGMRVNQRFNKQTK